MTKATIVIDLGYGDAGKGAHVDYLCRTQDVSTVVRFNGGPQAGHNVVTPDGKHHEFHQFGSGTLAGADTYLSEFMMINPMMLAVEARQLEELTGFSPYKKLWVDRRCQIISPYNEFANQIIEGARGDNRHGSCGLGIGDAVEDRINGSFHFTVGDVIDMGPDKIGRMLDHQRLWKLDVLRDEIREVQGNPDLKYALDGLHDPDFTDAVAGVWDMIISFLRITDIGFLEKRLETDHVVFEAAQGVLLDEYWGHQPYTTWSKTTRMNADELLNEIGYDDDLECHGLTRAYSTRHGRGPLKTESPLMTLELQDEHNPTNPWQEHFRVGPLDLVMLRYALRVADGEVDSLVVSCLDRLEGRQITACNQYVDDKPVTQDVNDLPTFIENSTGIPVKVVAYGPTADDRKVRESTIQ